MAYALEFERRSTLQKYLVASIAMHAAVSGGLLWWSWWEGRERAQFGDPNSLGGTPITPVPGIPVVSRGPQNPLANDTESQIPRQPKPETKEEEKDDPAAVVLKGREAPKKQKKLAAKQTFQPKKETRPSQVYSTTGARTSSEMFTAQGGTGGVGVGQSNPFGARFGWYADLIRQRVSQKWRTQEVDPRVDSAPVVILIFDIHRAGQVTNIRLLQRSGNYSLDVSAQRAVQEASPLPPLPDGFDRNSATVEFHFQLKR